MAGYPESYKIKRINLIARKFCSLTSTSRERTLRRGAA